MLRPCRPRRVPPVVLSQAGARVLPEHHFVHHNGESTGQGAGHAAVHFYSTQLVSYRYAFYIVYMLHITYP